LRCQALPHTAARRQKNFANPLDAFFGFTFANFQLLAADSRVSSRSGKRNAVSGNLKSRRWKIAVGSWERTIKKLKAESASSTGQQPES
jgi:hypothetical protein